MTRAHNPKNKRSESFSGSVFDSGLSDVLEILVKSGILVYDPEGDYRIHANGILGTFSIKGQE
jgi:hypothetical protein